MRQAGGRRQAAAADDVPGAHLAPVIPLPSCRLVKGAMDKDGQPVDEWRDFIGRFRELTPDQAAASGVPYEELVPDDRVAASIPRAFAVNQTVDVSEDPGHDAFGDRGGRSGRVGDLPR